MGLRFSEQPNLFGKPDFKISGTQLVVFCDSSFWHGRHMVIVERARFGRNEKLWVEKLYRNIARDREVNQVLRMQGWIVLRFWDTDIIQQPQKVADVIIAHLGSLRDEPLPVVRERSEVG
jgi:DNA mismatch endonuclease Vsr